ncbi:MAG: DUF177 domain-containing protein [Alphaproteobacteria bacterium]|nr:DUF177 domain-containing protein [Alphaproteobacteria bacterium]
MQKDFSYILKTDDLKQNEQYYHLSADKGDLEVLKDILKVEDVKSFKADMALKMSHKLHRLDIKGEVRAVLEVKSVVSLENFEKEYIAPFEYYFDTSLTYQDIRDMDAGIDEDVPEIIENGQIDLAQIAIEQLSLIMDDYPRKEGEIFVFQSEFDDETTKQANPFAVLEKLKK